MNRQEIQRRLDDALNAHRHHDYAYWKERIGDAPMIVEAASESDERFTIEIDPVWDGSEGGDIRVLCSIDYGGLSSFAPPTADFIIRPDGTFVP